LVRQNGTIEVRPKLRFLSIRQVPSLFWSSPKALTITPPLASVVFLVIGLVLFGLGDAMIIAAGVGVSPWTVLAQGITSVTGWSIGFSTFIISLFVLFCWIPLRQTLGMGTILNAIIIALVLEFFLPYIPVYDSPALKISEAVIGVLVTGFGGGVYLIANLGPGPRDGLMTGLQALTNLPIVWVRSALELSAIAAGWALGGSVGIGTVLFALGIGPAVASSMYGLQYAFSESETNL
jgi:uncharacterized membrane protein YczE